MNSVKNFFKNLFKILLYTFIFSLLFFLAYKYVNWGNLKGDIYAIVHPPNKSEAMTSQFAPSTLSLGLDYNGSNWIENLKLRTSEWGLEIKEILPTSESKSIVNILLNNSMILKINLDQNFNETWSNFTLLYNSKNFKNDLLKGVEYVDLRNENKIYYKLINNLINSSSTSSSAADSINTESSQ